MAEQNVNRLVKWSELLPQGGGSDEEEGSASAADDCAREFSDEDGPVGPTLKDHPYLIARGTNAELCTMCFSIVLPTRANLCPCNCRDTLVDRQSNVAKEIHGCKVVSGKRILGPKLKATLYEIAAA